MTDHLRISAGLCVRASKQIGNINVFIDYIYNQVLLVLNVELNESEFKTWLT